MRDVAFSCDDNGVPFLKVSVWSLLAHYKGSEPLRINVFEGWGGHSATHKAELQTIVDRFGFASLRYVDIEPFVEPYADLILNRAKSRWNVFTWTPIFTPAALPDATGTVIHFDIDMLFNADVSPLFELNLKSFLIACCNEYDRDGDNAGKVVWEKSILPPTVERYFNTGVLVFNSAACRAERTWEKLVAWYREHYDIADRIEQDAWNALYSDRVLALPVKWNFHDRNIKNYARWSPYEKYWLGNPPRECYEASLNPAILHFWGPKKPWKPSHRPYRKLYHAAMRAVGLPVPREELLSPYHDLVNALHLARIRFRQRTLSAWNWPQGRSAERMPALRRWERRNLMKALKHACQVPFEWMGIGLGYLILTNLPHRVVRKISDFAAVIMYRFDFHGKRRALENLHVLLGCSRGDEGTPEFDTDRAPYDPTPREEMIIRGSYRNMARTIGHAFWTCRNAQARVRSVGIMSEAGRAFLRDNKPAVTVSGHIGCWEILSQLALLEGHQMLSVAKRIGTEGMTRLLMKARRSIGQDIVPADGAFKPLMAGIKAGKSLGLLVDQRVDPDEGGVWIRFLGRPLSVSAAPAFFAAKAKAPIVVAWSRPLKDGRYRCEAVDVISPEEARDVWRTTQRCASDLERIIRRHPSCWVLNYNFFGNRVTEKDLETLVQREAK